MRGRETQPRIGGKIRNVGDGVWELKVAYGPEHTGLNGTR